MTLVAIYAWGGVCENEGCGLTPEHHDVTGRCTSLDGEHYFKGQRIPVFFNPADAQIGRLIDQATP